MSEIDTTKDVYLFTHGRMDLQTKSVEALVAKGFAKDKIFSAIPNKVGAVGDYMAMLWMPPNPDHIKITKNYQSRTSRASWHDWIVERSLKRRHIYHSTLISIFENPNS